MKSRGFTLFHVIVSTLFFSLVLSTAFPLIYTYMQAVRLHGASQSLSTALVSARMQAVKQSRPVVLCSSEDGISCNGKGNWERGFIVFVDEDLNGRLNGVEKPHHVHSALNTGATIRSEYPNSHQVVYLPSGRVQSTDKFNICINEVAATGRTIELMLTGRPQRSTGASRCPGELAFSDNPIIARN
jgi:type IV fimbrial biogenesis protein FimT